MNLERMRQSQVYNSYLNAANLEQLVDKYGQYGCIAYQDLFTFIFTEKPQLFTLLDCTWNRQLDTVYKHIVLSTDIFDAFHRCHGDVKIYHANGGSLLLDDQF